MFWLIAMEPPSLGEMSVLRILIFGVIFGVIVRLFYDWCASGYSGLDEEDEDGGSRKIARNHTATGSLDIALLPLAEVKDREGKKDNAVGEYRGTGLQSLIDKTVLNAARFPMVLDEAWGHELESLFVERKVQHGNALGHIMNPESQANPLLEVEGVQNGPCYATATDDFGNEASRAFRAAKVTILHQPKPSVISLEKALHDCPARPPIVYPSTIDIMRLNNTFVLPTSDNLKVRTFHGSEGSNSDTLNEPATEQPSATGEEFWLNFRENNKVYATLSSGSSHKSSDFGHGIHIPKPDTRTNSQRSSSAGRATITTQRNKSSQAWRSKEMVGIFKDEEYKPQSSTIPHNHRELTAIPIIDTITSLPETIKTVNEDSQPKSSGNISLTMTSPQLSSPRGLRNPATHVPKEPGFKDTEGFPRSLPRSSLINQPIPAPLSSPQTLEFTPGSLFRNPRPFGGTNITQTILIPPGNINQSKSVHIFSSIKIAPCQIHNLSRKATINAKNRRPIVPQRGSSTQIAPQNALASNIDGDSPFEFQPRRIFKLHESKMVGLGQTTEFLDYTPDDLFRNPRVFPQTSVMIPRDPENGSQPTKELGGAPELPTAKKRLLQNGSLDNPMIGRVKLVSKVPGKDPRFTYLTWGSSGVKRNRSPHNCQEKGGCKGCD